MRRLSFVLFPLLALPYVAASAQGFTVGYIEAGKPPIEGGQCEFSDRSGVILKGDWVSKFWMNIDGTLIEFQGSRTDAAMVFDFEHKRWHETFGSLGISATLDLRQTATGEDTATYEGTLLMKRGRVRKRLVLSGGCGA